MSPVFEALDHAHIQMTSKRAASAKNNNLNEYEDDEDDSGSVEDIEDDIPDSLDWREMGFITSSKNQKSCGSCYAFSIALSIEGQVFKRTGKLLSLSEQQIVDCSIVLGNHGCAGGSLRNTLRYLSSTRGIMREEDYPYTSSVTFFVAVNFRYIQMKHNLQFFFVFNCSKINATINRNWPLSM